MNQHPAPLLYVAEAANAQMVAAAIQAHPNETGGVLVGVYLEGHPWVTHVVEIPTTNRGRHHYQIPAGQTRPAIRHARSSDPRLGYLGDWHTHPNDVGPSPKDLATLALFSLRHPRSPNPTLVVVRHQEQGHMLEARRILSVTARPCDVRYTGSLPPPAQDETPNDASYGSAP